MIKYGFEPMNTRIQTLLVGVILGSMTLLAYVPSMRGGYVWDDDAYLTEDPRMGSLDGLGRIWTEIAGENYRHQYYPMTISGFWIQHHFWGFENAAGYHVTNVLLHAANAILLWRVLNLLAIPGSWIAAAIFAVHPVHVMSVAWITELKNVLSTLFFMLSALAWIRAFGLAKSDSASTENSDTKARWIWYGLGMVMFACALLSKTATAILPIGLLLVLWWKQERIRMQNMMMLLPIVVLGAGFIMMTTLLERYYTLAQGDEFSHSWIERILIIGRALWFYAAKLVWPYPLTFIYKRWQIDSGIWWQYLPPAGILIVIGLLWSYRSRIGKGPFAAVMFFILAVAPMHTVNVYMTRFTYVSDHWQYWASMGLIVLAASGCRIAATYLGARGRILLILGGTVVLTIFGFLTWQRGHVYKNEETLWRDTLKKNPTAWMAHNNIASILTSQNKIDEALGHYDQALLYNYNAKEVHFSKANVLLLRNNDLDAIRHLREVIRIDEKHVQSHFILGALCLEHGKLDRAFRHLHKAIELRPNDANFHHTLGLTLRKQNKLDDAVIHFQKAIEFNPDRASSYFNFAKTLELQGKMDSAITQLRQALRLLPDYPNARNRLGSALLKTGQVDEALIHFSQIIEAHPELAGARFNLGQAYLKKGNRTRGAELIRQAVHQKPNLAELAKQIGVDTTIGAENDMSQDNQNRK